MSEIADILQTVREEAEEYLEQSDATPAEAAQEIAHQHDELYTPLRGNGRVDNLEVLMELRNHGALCGDELDIYRDNERCDSAADFAEATLAALTQRSLEKFLYDALTEDTHRTCYDRC
jgi:hypothetical protein